MHNFSAFISHDCFITPYGRYTGHRTVKHTECCTDIAVAVPAGVRKMAHDDEPIIGELFTATSRADNLQFLQINADSPAGIRIEFRAGWQNFRTGFRHGISNLVSRNSGADWTSMKNERIGTGNGRLIRKAYGNNFNYAPELHRAIMKIRSFPLINCNANPENLVRNFNVNINTISYYFSGSSHFCVGCYTKV